MFVRTINVKNALNNSIQKSRESNTGVKWASFILAKYSFYMPVFIKLISSRLIHNLFRAPSRNSFQTNTFIRILWFQIFRKKSKNRKKEYLKTSSLQFGFYIRRELFSSKTSEIFIRRNRPRPAQGSAMLPSLVSYKAGNTSCRTKYILKVFHFLLMEFWKLFGSIALDVRTVKNFESKLDQKPQLYWRLAIPGVDRVPGRLLCRPNNNGCYEDSRQRHIK